MAGLTLDSGALIAYEQRVPRARALIQRAVEQEAPPTVPTAVIAEVWPPGYRSVAIAELLEICEIEDLDDALAKQASLLRRETSRDTSVVDAVVVVSAARRGDAVLTDDFDDMTALAANRPAVRVLTCQGDR